MRHDEHLIRQDLAQHDSRQQDLGHQDPGRQDVDLLIRHLTMSVTLSQSLRMRLVNRLLTMALIELGQDIAADEVRDTQASDNVA